ncbi:TPA_exp: Uncharacterized protein A8136_3226 [Trichophyton benhamiae CBS 112371]|uniref:Uncharacterized protein n=1 Tax=Arthroderma benhamiae (strain ATCC MYA-4681 / CBS 112371) TaxID=663331 RepID=D4AZR9_ARTBC|nr:uncharacterized protein ARB_01687 [Trichophyton benhamiae CBS 112371]EFE31539.1 hypothetical protein ARB_01687 [Trichophyton benhamiae CBS 112371]DAA74688.1 TPA_exp: Uncharacterized protein A8136_3226 [Trichophyton benhamiae CBS 112371]
MKAASALATLALLAVAPQPTQAAFPGFTIIAAGLIGIIGRALGTAIQGARVAATFDATALPPGVPQFEYERCRNDIKGRTIEINTNYQNHLEVKGLLATCMNLANVMAGDGTQGPYALPCGSDCLFYDAITPAQIEEFRHSLGL